MKKQKQKKRRIRNPVAKNMEEFNRPVTHRDRTKYKRKDKHIKGSQDPFIAIVDKYFNAYTRCNLI